MKVLSRHQGVPVRVSAPLSRPPAGPHGFPECRPDRRMFVVAAEKHKRPERQQLLHSPQELSESARDSARQSRSFEEVSACRRVGGTAPRPHKSGIVAEASANTAESYQRLEGVCCCVGESRRD